MSEKIRHYWNKLADENTEYNHYNRNGSSRFEDTESVVKNPEKAFPAAVYPLIKKYLGNFKGKKILVPSSGDNKAVFGFHLLGAEVVSCDISENQLRNAKIIADIYGWDIKFLQQDSMTLESVESGVFDLVYTSNGVHVWIDDLCGMYRNFNRVLKNGGYNMFFETHPMLRPFEDNDISKIKIMKPYEMIKKIANDGVERYEWRIQDFVNAIISSEFTIKEMLEFTTVDGDLDDYLPMETNKNHANYGLDMKNWEINPWAALPQCFGLFSKKIGN